MSRSAALNQSDVQVWALQVSSLGDFLITGSHDRSIRRWEKTEETFFLEEEKEKRLERILDTDSSKAGITNVSAEDEGGNTVVTASSQTQVRALCTQGVSVSAIQLLSRRHGRRSQRVASTSSLMLWT